MKTIFWEGEKLSLEEIPDVLEGEVDSYLRDALTFCQAWRRCQQQFIWQTSGSTGKPKEITVSRQQMLASANQTIQFLHLNQDDHALVCLHTGYIAGAMMLVRALESGMDMTLVKPSNNPMHTLIGDVQPTFTALVPLQVHQILSEKSDGLTLLNGFKTVLVGGAAVDIALEQQIEKLTPNFYATYGMTETVSHIALRKLGYETSYQILDASLQCALDERGCLTIQGMVTEGEKLVTNDRVEFTGNRSFNWLGRYDAVINSGGVKVQPEQVEAATLQCTAQWGLSSKIMVVGIPDAYLGQKVILAVEGTLSEQQEKALIHYWKSKLPRYHAPKKIVKLKVFPQLPNGKVDRLRLVAIIEESLN